MSIRTIWLLIFSIILSGCEKQQQVFDEETTYTFSGKLVGEVFPGLPNYRSIEEGDDAEMCLILYLDNPISVYYISPEGDKPCIAEGVSRLHVFTTREKYMSYDCFLWKKVLVSGRVSLGLSPHHHAEFLLETDRISPPKHPFSMRNLKWNRL